MNSRWFFLKLFIIVSISVIFSACGYKPSSYYAKKEISGNVFVSSTIDIDNTLNSVLIKDVMNEIVINQFDAHLVDKQKNADIIIYVKLDSVSHTALETSSDGYTKSYRTTVSISVEYKKENQAQRKLSVSNYYDYAIDNDTIVTNEKKQEAIRLASSKALSNIFSKIAMITFQK